MSQNRKLIAVDLDNTVFTPNTYETFHNLSALYLAKEAGIHVCACTGRPWYNARHFFALFPFDELCVTSNGAAIVETYTGRQREVHCLDPQNLPQLLEYLSTLKELSNPVRVSTNEHFAVWNPQLQERMVEERGDWLFGQYPGRTIYYRERKDWIEAVREEAQRILLAFSDITQEDLGEISQRLCAIMPVEATISFHTMVEVMAPGCTKGRALSRLAEMLGGEQKNVMAIGDNINDVSMVEWAGTGVCVREGQEALKRVADLIVPEMRLGGLKATIEYFIEV